MRILLLALASLAFSQQFKKCTEQKLDGENRMHKSFKMLEEWPDNIVAEQGELLEIDLQKYFGGEDLQFELESETLDDLETEWHPTI